MLLIAGICASFATYKSGAADQEQKDTIQKLGEKNKDLNELLIKLNILNNNITSNVQDLVKTNNKLSETNIVLATESQALIEEVKTLSEKSQQIISTVDKRTEVETAQNLQTGTLDMVFDNIVKDDDNVRVKFGGTIMGNTVKDLKSGKAKLILSGNKDLLSLKFDNNNRMLFSLRIFDIDNNLIAEIENNSWRPNKNFTGKFNYDNRGFEVIDNKGNVAIRVNVIANNTIDIQGVFPMKEENIVFICGENMLQPISFPVSEEKRKSYNELIKEINIKPLFRYTGANWLHSRL